MILGAFWCKVASKSLSFIFMAKRKIVALVGLPGSGKTEAISYLMKKLGWPRVYLGDATFEELAKRKMIVNEKNERLIREELREKYGPACYALRAIKKIKKLPGNILVESLYSWEEYSEFKKVFKNNFLVAAIYASPKTRYARLSGRKIRPLAAAEVKSREESQIVNLHQGGPIAMADWTINNDASRRDFNKKLNILSEILKNGRRNNSAINR